MRFFEWVRFAIFVFWAEGSISAEWRANLRVLVLHGISDWRFEISKVGSDWRRLDRDLCKRGVF
jgi:hypothetical protein